MPKGCIFADKGPAVFVDNDNSDDLLALAAIANSRAFMLLVSLQLARTELAQSFEVGLIQNTPIPHLSPQDHERLAKLARRAWSLKKSLDTRIETSHAFVVPALLQVSGMNVEARATACATQIDSVVAEVAAISTEIDARCFDLYSIAKTDQEAIIEGFGRTGERSIDPHDAELDADEEAGNDYQTERGINVLNLTTELVSWAVGVAFGRFDVRLATRARPLPDDADPFDALPVCSPAMLTSEEGMPLTIPPAGYQIAIPDNGILVDDRGHARDLCTAVRAVFDEVFKQSVDRWWNEIAALLEPRSHELGVWLASNFFDYHLKRYYKSRRKAPIIWQIAVPSGQYSVWLYSHRLTRDTLFQVQNDVVTPKLAHEERQLTSLIQAAGDNPSAKERKEIAEHEAIVEELRSFLAEVKRVAPLWNPVLDDGVVLSMAALWRLVPQHKLWQKELKAKWDELVDERYDWSHAAMHFWPERVVPKSAADRSLAISHGLEAAFWVQSISGRWQQRLGIADTVRYLEQNLSSDRLRQTVEELVAFSESYATASGDAPGWWAALSTGFHDDTALALALWPERVIRKAVADPTRFAALGIKLPRARNGDELVAKLSSMHRPRLLDQEIQALGEFCDGAGDRDYWSRRWAQFAAGIHDECGLAGAVHTPRVVAKAQADPDFAKLHGLFRWFWLLGDSGPRPLKEPPDEIADALRIRSSLAVKAALKSLVEAPTATVGGSRGRGRQATAAAADGGTH